MSTEKIVVRPAKGGNPVERLNESYYASGTIGGVRRTMSLGKFESERWEGTATNFIPQYYNALGHFSLMREDGTYWTNEDLQPYVEKMKLRYEYGENKGKLIEFANIFDCDDPFLCHSTFQKLAKEGELIFGKERPEAEIVAAAIKGNREVQRAGAEARPGTVSYILTDRRLDEEIAQRRRREKVDAFTLYSNMSDDRKRLVASALGFGVNTDTDIMEIDRRLFEFVEDDKTRDASGLTKQQLFVKAAKSDPEELMLKQLINTGLSKGLIKRNNGMYSFQATPLGTSIEKVKAFFEDADNVAMREALQIRLDETN